MESYAFNEALMLEGIRAYQREIVPEKPTGCVHGNANFYINRQGKRVCRLCRATCSRRHYVKNKDYIKAHKKAYRERLQRAA